MSRLHYDSRVSEDHWKKLSPLAIIISIPENEERRRQSLEECNVQGLFPNVLVSKKDVKDSIRGCWNSHRNAALYAKEHGYKRVLIMEDDITFAYETKRTSELVEELANVLNSSTEDWIMAMLGHIPVSPVTRVTESVIVGKYFRYMHAYVLSERGIDVLSNLEYNDMHIDQVLGQGDIVYACYPQIILQRDLNTSNDSSNIYVAAAILRNIVGYRSFSNFCNTFMLLLGNLTKPKSIPNT